LDAQKTTDQKIEEGIIKDPFNRPEEKTTAQKIDETVKSAEGKPPQASTNFEDIDNISGITVTQMKKDLKARGVEYPANAKKDELFRLWALK
jgi:hypothetical protein